MKQRDRIALAVVGVLVALGAYWFALLSPARDDAAALRGQIDTARQQLNAARQQEAAYRAARSTYATSYATVVRLGKAVPGDDDVPSLLVQLNSTADRAQVDFRTFKLTGSGGGAAPAPAPAGGSSGDSSPSGSGGQSQPSGGSGQPANGSAQPADGSAQPAGGAPAPVPPMLPPGAAVGPAGFPAMPFSFIFRGPFLRLASFIEGLERYVRLDGDNVTVGGRLLVLDGFNLASGASTGGGVLATITATAFLTPADQGLTAGATPAAPAGAAAPSSGASASTTTPPPATITGVGR